MVWKSILQLIKKNSENENSTNIHESGALQHDITIKKAYPYTSLHRYCIYSAEPPNGYHIMAFDKDPTPMLVLIHEISGRDRYYRSSYLPSNEDINTISKFFRERCTSRYNDLVKQNSQTVKENLVLPFQPKLDEEI